MKAPANTVERKTTFRRKIELQERLDGAPRNEGEDLLVDATGDLTILRS